MSTACLALFWHQHQPYYSDDLRGETLMPWVRLHGTKNYIGMALHIKEVPEFRCTINLVPSLLTIEMAPPLALAPERALIKRIFWMVTSYPVGAQPLSKIRLLPPSKVISPPPSKTTS